MESEVSAADLKQEKKHYAAQAGGVAAGAYKNVNNLYNQERLHANQGHGFAAEQANDLIDQLHGKEVHKGLGDDNAKDGPDRMVNGQWIQSKYYQDGAKAIDACFRENGKGALRYYDQNHEPMRIEVPNDEAIYNKAVKRMETKIENGQVEGVTDPAKAKEIVQRGNCTYKQARNIAKAGNIDSLKFDAANGAVVATSAFGVSAVVAFATSVWNGDSPKVAAKRAAYCGIKVGGTSFVVSVLSSQLLKAGLNSAMVAGTEGIATALGPKACAVIVNAFRSGAPIYGAAAMKSAAKLLRGNAAVAGLTIVVCSVFDVADIVRGRISAGQLVKNLANTLTTVGGGAAGWIGGAAVGSIVMPGLGSIVGGLVGSMGGGALAGTLTNKIAGVFFEDDAKEMQRIIQEQVEIICIDNLMNKDEVEELVGLLSDELSAGKLKAMYASKDRGRFVGEMTVPHVRRIIGKRPKIGEDAEGAIEQGLIDLLNEWAEKGEFDESARATEEDR